GNAGSACAQSYGVTSEGVSPSLVRDERGHLAVEDGADLDTRGELVAVLLARLGVRFDQAHVFIHVNDRHDRAGLVRGVATGAVEGPAVVEADLAEVERRVVQGIVLLLHRAADLFLALVADAEL